MTTTPPTDEIDQQPPRQIQILVVEDDEGICMLLEEYLQDNGFDVKCVHDGTSAIRRFERGTFDLILLDIMLPGLSGLEVLDRVRRTSMVPVILLTALGEEADRVKGLDRGADDYIVKPYSPRELLARIQSLLRRMGRRTSLPANVIEMKPLQFHCDHRELTIQGEKVALTDQEFETLIMLVRNIGRVVSRDEMSRLLLGRPAGPQDRATDIRICRLRIKIAPWGDCIRSVRGMGYEFVPPHDVSAAEPNSD